MRHLTAVGRPEAPLMRLRDLWTLPSALTTLRLVIGATAPFWIASPWALGWYLLAILSDVLDGMLARRTGTATRAGAVYDAFVDKTLHVNLGWSLAVADRIPDVWMLAWCAREILQAPMVIIFAHRFRTGQGPPPQTTTLGRATALSLFVAVVLVLLGRDATVFTWLTGLLGTASAVHYGWRQFHAWWKEGTLLGRAGKGVLLLLVFAGTACAPKEGDSGRDDTATYAGDADGDGVASPSDCNDHDPAVYPGVDDAWYDGIDADCAGNDDYDADGDGGAAPPAGGDCEDADPTVYAGHAESCDGRDEDCDGIIDDDPAEGATVYTDADGDSYGTDLIPDRQCVVGAGQAAASGDCDDVASTIHPGVPEVCNGVDDDCDGYADNAAVDAPAWLPDFDADGYGDDTHPTAACAAPASYTTAGGDCDDGAPDVYPGAIETCDGRDEDCDGAVDDDPVNPHPYLPDVDGDEYGAGEVVIGCAAPDGYTERPGDCDDADPAISPRAEERCDGADNDCDGTVDIDAVDAVLMYPDLDLDGYGGDSGMVPTCAAPEGWLATGGDCDDAHAEANPAGVEVCDGLDDDCDGVTDPEGAPGSIRYYADLDGDHAAGGTPYVDACAAPAGYFPTADDCDDTEPRATPANREDCTTPFDDDCDGDVNEGSAYNATIYAPDADGDGYGDAAAAAAACAPPAGTVANADDCDDTDAAVFPGSPDGTCGAS